MPRLKNITSKKLIKLLKKNGFKIDRITGSHFIFYNSNNKKRIVVPFHNKDLPKGTLNSIIKQSGIEF